jgi:hypothetical protein
MKMIPLIVDLDHFRQQARRVRAGIAAILSRRGLSARFNRWLLTQDPATGLVVLFAVLNTKFIAAHTTKTVSEYFDPHLLQELANGLHVQVVSCNTDDLRYAFVLDHGSLDRLPTHIEFPFLDGDRLFVHVVYNEKLVPEELKPHIMPPPQPEPDLVDDQALVEQGVRAFLKVFNADKRKRAAALQVSNLDLPDIVMINEDEFHSRVKDHADNLQRINHIRQLLGGSLEGGSLEVSKKMEQAMFYALANGGKLRRYPGGFWAMESWQPGQAPWFGGSTITAIVSRGLMVFTEWHEGRKGLFPVAAVTAQSLQHLVQSAD